MQPRTLYQRTLSSIGWQMGSSAVSTVILFARSVLLARLLPVDVFGAYAFATSVLTFTAPLTEFGMASAFLHRGREVIDEDEAAAVHLSLKALFLIIWAGLIILGALFLAHGQERVILVVLVIVRSITYLSQTPRLILHRRVVHRRIALLNVLNAIFTTIFAVSLAYLGFMVWALVATDVIIMLLSMLMLYVWRPVWHPRLTWRPQLVRYYLSFGSRVLVSDILSVSLDQVDDLWTRAFLGNTPLGLYSRAYTFASYPRTILAAPVTMVMGGTYAELKGRRISLSRTFFRTNALLLRAGFLLGGLLFLVAPEFIRLVIGAKWLPMLAPFRLMLVFALLQPLKSTISSMFIAVGKPVEVLKTRLMQLLILIPALFLLGLPFGITGVAIAVDLMAAAGTVALLHKARVHVDYSMLCLFAAPLVALSVAIPVAYVSGQFYILRISDWLTGTVKGLVYALIYGALLFTLEREKIIGMVRQIELPWSQKVLGS